MDGGWKSYTPLDSFSFSSRHRKARGRLTVRLRVGVGLQQAQLVERSEPAEIDDLPQRPGILGAGRKRRPKKSMCEASAAVGQSLSSEQRLKLKCNLWILGVRVTCEVFSACALTHDVLILVLGLFISPGEAQMLHLRQ